MNFVIIYLALKLMAPSANDCPQFDGQRFENQFLVAELPQCSPENHGRVVIIIDGQSATDTTVGCGTKVLMAYCDAKWKEVLTDTDSDASWIPR